MNYEVAGVPFKPGDLQVAAGNFGLQPDPFPLFEGNGEVPLGLGEYFEFKGIVIDSEGDLHGNFRFGELINPTGEFAENKVSRLEPIVVRGRVVIKRRLLGRVHALYE